MQKIMFNDKFGLTKAVLEGKKTQTRRIIPESWLEGLEEFQEEYFNDTLDHIEGKDLLEQYFLIEQRKKPHFAVGKIVAVAQKYISTEARSSHPSISGILKAQDHSEIIPDYKEKSEIVTTEGCVSNIFSGDVSGHSAELAKDFNEIFVQAGKNNKMFVKAALMPHQIRITNIRLQRLQDISDEDCLKEGIIEDCPGVQYSFPTEIGYCGQYPFDTPKAAYAALIDKISGEGTWEKNPWVFVYDFELVK